MGLVKVRPEDRADFRRREDLLGMVQLMVIGGYRTKENVVKIKRWVWSAPAEMWYLVGQGDFTLQAGQEMLGVELPVKDIVYTVHVGDVDGDEEFTASRWGASFHEVAARLIGRTDIMFTDGVDTAEDVAPFCEPTK